MDLGLPFYEWEQPYFCETGEFGCEPLSHPDSDSVRLEVDGESYSDVDSLPLSSQFSTYSSDLIDNRFSSEDYLLEHSYPITYVSGDFPRLDLYCSPMIVPGEVEESSLHDQEYNLAYDVDDVTKQEYASGSSSDDSYDSVGTLLSPLTQETKPIPKNKRKAKKPWSKSEDEKLRMICEELDFNNNKRIWNVVAQKLNSGRTPKQCREHYGRLIAVNKKHSWSADEDAVLYSFFEGIINYEDIFNKLKRSAKQVKERLSLLERNRKPWSQQEDDVITSLMKSNKRPRDICRSLKSMGFQRKCEHVKDRMAALSRSVHP